MSNPTRRTFFTDLATATMGPVVLGRRAFAQNPSARVDGTALRQRIEALSMFGRRSGGTFADGVSRVAYSDADVDGRRYMIDLMRAAGLAPRVDPAGNIFGRRAGTDASLPPILFGSHIDSVPHGGNFDGDSWGADRLRCRRMEALTSRQFAFAAGSHTAELGPVGEEDVAACRIERHPLKARPGRPGVPVAPVDANRWRGSAAMAMILAPRSRGICRSRRSSSPFGTIGCPAIGSVLLAAVARNARSR